MHLCDVEWSQEWSIVMRAGKQYSVPALYSLNKGLE